jgi:hypothetical protein
MISAKVKNKIKPEVLKEAYKQRANMVMRYKIIPTVQEMCPKITGRLARSFIEGDNSYVYTKGNNLIIKVGTPVEYAANVEYGLNCKIGTIENPIPSSTQTGWRPFLRPAFFLHGKEWANMITEGVSQ